MRKIIIEGCPAEIYVAEIAEASRSGRREKEEEAVGFLVRKVFGAGATRRHLPDGAPAIEGIRQSISISHSKRFAALAVAPAGSLVGIDIEANRSQLERVCGRILSPAEYNCFSTAPQGFLKAWTTKEALYKASRRLFCHEPDYASDLHILPSPSAAGHTFRVYSTTLEPEEMITVVIG